MKKAIIVIVAISLAFLISSVVIAEDSMVLTKAEISPTKPVRPDPGFVVPEGGFKMDPDKIALYDYYELQDSNDLIIVATYTVPEHIFGKIGYHSVYEDVVRRIVKRCMTKDLGKNVSSYVISIISYPDTVIQFELDAAKIKDLIKKFGFSI